MHRNRVAPAPLALAVILAVSAPADARPLEDLMPVGRTVCFERQYDAAHLAAHPRQKVGAIMMLYEGHDEGRTTYVTLFMNLRDRVAADDGFDYRLTGACKASGKGLFCSNEWDAGAWRLEKAADGSLLVRNDGVIMPNPYAYDAEDLADDHVKVTAEPDDKIFRLARAPAARCRP